MFCTSSPSFRVGWLGLIGGLLLSQQGRAMAADADEWLYSFQPGDNLWNITERFLIDQSYWSRLVRLNKVRHPRRMPPGTQVRIPLRWLKVEAARIRVRDVRGQVLLSRAEGSRKSLEAGDLLQQGDRLSLEKDASLLLEFADGTRQLLGGGTEVELVRVNRFSDTGIGDTTIRVLRGDTENRVPRAGTRFEIRTPSANTAVRGTRFRVKVPPAEQNRSRVEVLEGTVNVSADMGRLMLPAGFGTLVEQGKAPAPAVELLPAPVMETVSSVMRALPLELRWHQVEGAQAYRLRLFNREGDGVPVLDVRLAHARFSSSALPDGDYRLRLSALDAAGLEGKEVETAFVLDARPLPPVAMRPAPASTLRGDRAGFEWSTPPEVSSYVFQLSPDPDFLTGVTTRDGLRNTRLEISPLRQGAWFWRVASVYQGEQGPWGEVQRFELKPELKAPQVGVATDKDQVQLHWQPGEQGQRYHLQIAEDKAFRDLLVDELLEEPRWASPRADNPVYFRVRIIDSDGYAGAWSPAQAIFPEPEPWYVFGIPAIAIILLAL